MTDKETKSERIHIMLSPSELAAIDEWRFNNRIASRGEAIRQLVRVGTSLTDDATIGYCFGALRDAAEAHGIDLTADTIEDDFKEALKGAVDSILEN